MIDWYRARAVVDIDRVDDVLDGWDPEAEERAARALERRLRSAVG